MSRWSNKNKEMQTVINLEVKQVNCSSTRGDQSTNEKNPIEIFDQKPVQIKVEPQLLEVDELVEYELVENSSY